MEAKELLLQSLLQSPSTKFELLYCAAIGAGGFVRNQLRKDLWLRLLDISWNQEAKPLKDMISSHPDTEQVTRDTDRSLWRFTTQMTPQLRDRRRRQLTEIILAVLSTDRSLHYYQGFHEVVSVVLLICTDSTMNEERDEVVAVYKAFLISRRLAATYLRCAMLEDLSHVRMQLSLLLPLVKCVSPAAATHLQASVSHEPLFALSWLLTWYSYNIEELHIVARLFDFFIVEHPLAPLYVAAALIGARAAEILQVEREYAAVHGLLSRVPPGLAWDDLVFSTHKLMQRFSPERLLSGSLTAPLRLTCAYPFEFRWKQLALKSKLVYRWNRLPRGSVGLVGVLLASVLIYQLLVTGKHQYLRQFWLTEKNDVVMMEMRIVRMERK